MSLKLQITEKLNTAFTPDHLEVINESHNHNVPKGSESHFKVVIVSDFFLGKRLIARHRAVNSTLADELKNHIHALAIHTYSQDEWSEVKKAPESPDCMGGMKFEN